MKVRTKKKSQSKGKIKSYQKDKRDILQFVPKLRKVKKDKRKRNGARQLGLGVGPS